MCHHAKLINRWHRHWGAAILNLKKMDAVLLFCVCYSLQRWHSLPLAVFGLSVIASNGGAPYPLAVFGISVITSNGCAPCPLAVVGLYVKTSIGSAPCSLPHGSVWSVCYSLQKLRSLLPCQALVCTKPRSCKKRIIWILASPLLLFHVRNSDRPIPNSCNCKLRYIISLLISFAQVCMCQISLTKSILQIRAFYRWGSLTKFGEIWSTNDWTASICLNSRWRQPPC